MRDAFGGAFSIKLILVFLILYISFICVAINYSRAFRVKNRIINIIEEYEGYPMVTNTTKTNQIDAAINAYLLTTGYYIDKDDVGTVSSCNDLIGLGYCIVEMNSNPLYYKVETYMVFTLPIVNVSFPIRIQGETRRIETLP